MTTSSKDVGDEDQFFSTQADNENESEGHTIQRKRYSQQDAKEWAATTEPTILRASNEEFTKTDGNTTSNSMTRTRANALTRVDLVLTNLNFKSIQLANHIHMMKCSYQQTDDPSKIKQMGIAYSSNNGLLFRKHYGETGSVKCYRILITKRLVDELHRSLQEILEMTPEVPR